MSDEKKTFLIVDDFEAADRMAELLGAMGYLNTIQAEDGAEAWTILTSLKVDFVIANIDTPEVNGLSLLRLLRSEEKHVRIPYVLIAEEITKRLVFNAGRAGVDQIVVIPFTDDLFKNKIRTVLDLEENPRVKEAQGAYKRGVTLMKAGKYEEALKTFESVLTIHESPEIYYNMGYIRANEGDYDEAIQCFRYATKIDEDFVAAYRKMGEVYQLQGKDEMAAQYFQKSADLLRDRKDDREAEDVYMNVLKLKPDIGNVFNSLGIIYRRQGRFEDALEQYKKGIKVNPDDEAIYFNMGRVYVDLKNHAAARESFKKALDLNPKFTPARDMLRALEMGIALSN